MNREQRRALYSLSDEGYAVIVWTPEELGDVSARLAIIKRINDIDRTDSWDQTFNIFDTYDMDTDI